MLLIVIGLSVNVLAQEKLSEKRITMHFDGVTLEKALRQVEGKTQLKFAYNSKLFSATKKYNFKVENEPVKFVLEKLLKPQQLWYREVNGQIVLYRKKVNAPKVTISGYVSDISSGERLIHANVFETTTLVGTISNVYGFYSLSLPAGMHEIAYSFVGYDAETLFLNLTNDTIININLKGNTTIDEVKVVANDPSQVNLMSTQMSRVDLPLDKVEKLPAFLGEVDVIKALQLMPGVQSGTEGTSGLYVRGGGPDQNLILLDGVPLYNPNHLMGFFSVFNPNAIKNISLCKGSFPAEYGGRLSSVLDIRMKEGNEKEFHGNIKVGLISSNINLEGPIKKDKTAFNISARRTYLDLLTRPFIKKNAEGNDMGYYFYDFNAKVNHKFSDKDRLFLSVYSGKDDGYGNTDDDVSEGTTNYSEENKFSLNWSNVISALRWNHIYNNKLFSNTTLTYSTYNFNVTDEYTTKKPDNRKDYYNFRYRSGIEDFAGKIEFDYFPNPNHTLKFGANYTYHTYRPGVTTIKEQESSSTVSDTIISNNSINSHEYYVFAQDNIEIGSRLKVNIGAHYSGFYVEDKLFHSFQPRISMRFLASPKLSFKAAYSKMNQYIHLLSSSTISLPTDLWLPITKETGPQRSHQFGFGAFYNIAKGIDFSLEGYYKETSNLIEYKEGASFSDSNRWQDKIETGGKGWSYGLEALLRKSTGNTTGWIGYTWAWADRQFDNLNFGKKYPFRYDRRHDVGIAINHKFNDRIDIGATWVYGTGNAVTFSTSSYNPLSASAVNQYSSTEPLPYYSGRNNYRMPSYHRLDLGINFNKKLTRGTRTWSVGVYNAYSRKNPFFIYKTGGSSTSKQKIKQISLFPIIPSVSYSYKF